MILKQLAREPKLIKITIDDEDIVKTYGEPIDFYMFDRQPMGVFLKLASVDGNMEAMFEVIKDMIFDDKGKVILDGKNELPVDVMMALINKVVEYMGKPETQTTPK